MKSFVFTVLLLSVLSFSAYAEGDSGERTLSAVRVVSGDIISLEVDTAFDNPDNCGNTSRAVILQSDPGADKKLSVSLSAFMGKKLIGMWFQGCVATPWGYTAPRVYTVYVTN